MASNYSMYFIVQDITWHDAYFLHCHAVGIVSHILPIAIDSEISRKTVWDVVLWRKNFMIKENNS